VEQSHPEGKLVDGMMVMKGFGDLAFFEAGFMQDLDLQKTLLLVGIWAGPSQIQHF
jgi:hypothetical protein